jgi:hypothetical protein
MLKPIVFAILASSTIYFAAPKRNNPGPAAPTWTEATKFSLSYKAPVKKEPGAGADGAPGASAQVFTVGQYRGGAVLDRIDGKGVGVFIGIASTAQLEDAIAKGIKVQCTDASKKTQEFKRDAMASGATAMLFLSPDGLAPHEITSVQIMYDSSAPWAKKK